jgi:hypothetical protein
MLGTGELGAVARLAAACPMTVKDHLAGWPTRGVTPMTWDALVRALTTENALHRGIEGLTAFIALSAAASLRFRKAVRLGEGTDGLD